MLGRIRINKGRPESQPVYDFEHFRQNKGETIHNYYVWFAKLINDMRNIKMTMSKIQLNSKFVNNMLPEWGRFVIAVKLNKGLKDSNFDQLIGYMTQHEAHVNENKMMLKRLTQQTVDPLALMSNVSPQHYHSQSSTNLPTTYHQPHSADTSQSDLGISPTENLIENLTNTLALLTQVIVQNVQGRQNRGHGNNTQGAGAVGYGRVQNRVGNANLGQARQVKCYNCNGLAEDCDAYDSDVDDAPTTQTLFMANLSSADPVYDKVRSRLKISDYVLNLRSYHFSKLFKNILRHIQKALPKRVKEMSDAFDELELNLTKKVFYVASNSELNVSRFTKMQKAHHVVKAHCLELEAELSNLRDDVREDNYNDLLNRFSNLEANNLNLQLKYQNLKDNDTNCEIVEEAKVERPLDRSLAFACRYTKHSQELLDYVFGTCPKVFNQQDKKHANTPRKKQVTFEDQIATSSSTTHKHVEPMHTQKSNVPVPPSTGVNSCTDASGSQPRSILKKHRIPPAKSMKKVEEHPRIIRSSLKTTNRVDSSNSYKRTVIQIVLWYLDLGYSKHMTGDHSRLMNFVKKFIETVRFGNDHFGTIIGYRDYVVGDSVISKIWKLPLESILVMSVIRMVLNYLKVPVVLIYTPLLLKK
ncbi:hypothetical protein Tco_0102951 [Tanacetum coccineum]